MGLFVSKKDKNRIQSDRSTISGFFRKWFTRKESFTLIVIPHVSVKNVKSLKFSRWIITFFVIMNIVMLTILCLFVVSYYSLNNKLDTKRQEYQALQSLKEEDERQLHEYKLNEKKILEKIDILKVLENKLKELIEAKGEGVKTSSSIPQLASRGMGGGLPVYPVSKPQEYSGQDNSYLMVDTFVNKVNSIIGEFNQAIVKSQKQDLLSKSKPSVLPVYGYVTSVFGYRDNPFGEGDEFHTGIDIANKKGTPIRASGDGIVTYAGWDEGYGNVVKIDHQNGYETMYGHNFQILAHIGQEVKRGQVIALMGSTGRSTGTHCHFEVRLNDIPVNPNNMK